MEGKRPVRQTQRQAYGGGGNAPPLWGAHIPSGAGRTGGPESFFRPEDLLPALPGVTVLEVKYDEFLPEIVSLAVQTPDRRAGACSKYALCRRFD